MVLGISFQYTLSVIEIRGTKTTKLLRYWYWYWVILGCFRDFGIGIGIVKDFLKYWYWYWVLLRAFQSIGIGIGYC